MQKYPKNYNCLQEIVKKFINADFQTGLDQLSTLDTTHFSREHMAILNKINLLYLLGNIIDLPTINSILEHTGVKDKKGKIRLSSLLKNISYKNITDLFERAFSQNVEAKLSEMCAKDPSIFSREYVTVILDDSIFKQWLKESVNKDDDYGCFYSGQFNSKVFGFKVLCLGISIDGCFYPLFVQFIPKKKVGSDGKNTAETAHKGAEKLIAKWGEFASNCAKKGVMLPKMYFSCDSGYSAVSLSDACKKVNLTYMSVPKKSHNFTINKEKKKLSHFITIFEKLEKKHKDSLLKKDDNDNSKTEPFTWRVRATYESQNKEVLLLFFRLNGSNKVSVIYSTNLNIPSKTMRRHWFDRTYIEQFFKLLKHSMKIQNTRTNTKEKFTMKLYQFMFVGFYIQKFTRFIRKRFDFQCNRVIGIEGLKRCKDLRTIIDQMIHDLLQEKSPK
jgi:hypothetical protein